MFRMGFGCYLNGYGFKIGRKYLHLTRWEKSIDKMELSKSVINQLEEIADKYFYNDVNRVYEVMKMFGYYRDEEEAK